MPEYLHPGVYVEEVSSGVRPIEGVGTSTAGFVGSTAKGVPNKATFISSWSEFVRKFGYLVPNKFLPYAVSHFFANGGKRCYVVRALNQLSATGAQIDLPSQEGAPRYTLRVKAKGAGAWGNDLLLRIQSGSNNPASEFKLVLFQDDEKPENVVELFDNLSMNPTAANYVETEINGASQFIEVKDLKVSAVAEKAKKTTTRELASTVAFTRGGEDLIVEMPDGVKPAITFTSEDTNRDDVLLKLNTALTPLNLSAVIDSENKLTIVHNSAGYDRYFLLSGGATGSGRPLEGLAGFAQGKGAAIGAVARSVAAASFDTTGGNHVLKIKVNDAALPDIDLPINAAATPEEIKVVLESEFAKSRGLLRASVEGSRVVISTANKGEADTKLQVTGPADTVLQFRRIDRSGATNEAINGSGSSEPGFVQSAPGPFALADNSNFRIIVNNGTAAGDIAFTIAITKRMNLARVTAEDLKKLIDSVEIEGENPVKLSDHVATIVQDNRLVLRQKRKGPFYTLTVEDGLNSPNRQLRFETSRKHGFAEGDLSSPYLRPAASADGKAWQLQGGDDGAEISRSDYIGTPNAKTGLYAFDDVTDVNFIAIPGATDPDVISRAVGYCTVRGDCFFIADAEGKARDDEAVTDPSKAMEFVSNQVATKTSYGAIYYPWLLVNDDVGAGKNPQRYVPPSGFVAGLFARIDASRGVWKAPAGTEAGIVGALGLEYSVTDAEQDLLNPLGVNCIRRFPAAGIVVWGARTLATQSDPEWRYVPVRRYAIYLRQSIYRGTQWAVFEPNDAGLWSSLRANIEDFMMGEFRKGALAGTTPRQAFDVKCDADLNPPSEVNAGRVNMEVKFAPLKPAEFVIIRISQKVQRPES